MMRDRDEHWPTRRICQFGASIPILPAPATPVQVLAWANSLIDFVEEQIIQFFESPGGVSF